MCDWSLVLKLDEGKVVKPHLGIIIDAGIDFGPQGVRRCSGGHCMAAPIGFFGNNFEIRSHQLPFPIEPVYLKSSKLRRSRRPGKISTEVNATAFNRNCLQQPIVAIGARLCRRDSWYPYCRSMGFRRLAKTQAPPQTALRIQCSSTVRDFRLAVQLGLQPQGPGLLAHVLVSKYADHLPLYRQCEIYARQGIELERSTLAGWVGGTSGLLDPLVNALRVSADASWFAVAGVPATDAAPVSL